MERWYFATSFCNDFAVLGKQLTRYRSFIILSCFGNGRAVRAVTFLTNTSPFYVVPLTGNKIKIIKKNTPKGDYKLILCEKKYPSTIAKNIWHGNL